MCDKKIMLIIFIIILILIFRTPQVLANHIFYLLCGTIFLQYQDKHNLCRLYDFDHTFYDGALMSHDIKHNLGTYVNITCNKIQYNPCQVINNERVKNYSIFTSSISKLLHRIITQQKRDINIAIIVSIRNQLIYEQQYGNYIKFAYYTIKKNNTIEEICDIHHNAVQTAQNTNYSIKHTVLGDILKLVYVDYMFNSWKALSNIETVDNQVLTRVPRNNLIEEDINKLINNKGRAFTILDFFDNQHIISSVRYL